MSDFSWKSINHKIFGGKKAESIRFTGSGGHGLVTASVILAKAGVYEGHNVLQSQVYGAEARGGSTKSETSSEKAIYISRSLLIQMFCWH